MADRKNPYFDLIEDESPQRSTEHTDVSTQPVSSDQQAEFNPYEQLFENEAIQHDVSKSLFGAGVGAAGGYLSTGAGLHPLSPSGSVVSGSGLTSLAESLTGAPPGSVNELYQLTQPSQKAGTQLSAAARAAAEARVPAVPELSPLPPASAPTSAGEKWLANWANQQKEGFTGGIPEAAQTYQRGKSSGKVMSRLEKKFGQSPKLNIGSYTANKAAQEAEAAAKVRADLHAFQMHQTAERKLAEEAAKRAATVGKQAQATEQATRLAVPMSVLGRVLTGAGIGLGGYDAYRRMQEGDKTGAGLTAGATALGTVFPMLSPLAAAGMALYDDPEARKRFLDAMKPEGAWQQRMEGRFGLD